MCVWGGSAPIPLKSRSARTGGYRLSITAGCVRNVLYRWFATGRRQRRCEEDGCMVKLGLLFSHAKNEAYCPFCFLFLRAFATHAQCHVYSAVRFGRENTMSAFLAQCALSLHAIVCIFSAVRFELAGFQRSAL